MAILPRRRQLLFVQLPTGREQLSLLDHAYHNDACCSCYDNNTVSTTAVNTVDHCDASLHDFTSATCICSPDHGDRCNTRHRHCIRV